MACNDMRVAVFPSRFVDGDAELWYSPRNHRYDLRYVVQYRPYGCGTRSELMSCSYDAGDYGQSAGMIVDAITIVATPLLHRN